MTYVLDSPKEFAAAALRRLFTVSGDRICSGMAHAELKRLSKVAVVCVGGSGGCSASTILLGAGLDYAAVCGDIHGAGGRAAPSRRGSRRARRLGGLTCRGVADTVAAANECAVRTENIAVRCGREQVLGDKSVGGRAPGASSPILILGAAGAEVGIPAPVNPEVES